MANLGLQNKNPGNLKDPTTGSFRVFKTPEEGEKALIEDIKLKQSGQSKHIKPGASISQLANVWAPASDNNVPENWAKNVAKTLGVPTTYAFDQVPADQLAKGIQVAEGTSTLASSPKKETPQINREQLTANIDAMEQQGASQQEVQEYIDSLGKTSSQSTSQTFDNLIGGQGGQSQAPKTFDDLISGESTQKPADSGSTGNWFKDFANRQIGNFADIAAVPVQAGLSAYNKVTGSNIPDPYAEGMPGLFGGKYGTHSLSDVEGKRGSAKGVIGTVGTVAGTAGLLKSVLTGINVASNPAVQKAAAQYIPEVAQGQSLSELMSNNTPENTGQLYNAIKNYMASPDATAFEKMQLSKAASILENSISQPGLAPGALNQLAKKVPGLLLKTLGLGAGIGGGGYIANKMFGDKVGSLVSKVIHP